MQIMRLLLLLGAVFGLCAPAHAIEGPAAAGPVGGTDIRSAMLPPPGLYGGTFALAAEAYNFVDGHGDTISALETMHLFKEVGAPFLFYVPKGKVLSNEDKVGDLGLLDQHRRSLGRGLHAVQEILKKRRRG